MQSNSNQTSLFINPVEFERAAIHAHQYFLSTPFTCPNPDRPFERAICLLADSRIIDVSVTPNCINKDGSVNLAGVQQVYGSQVQKVIYRPNHELLHSLRQAAMVPKIKEYYDRNTPEKYAYLQAKHLERLQLMMLFSVSGRKDETGFHDSPEAREKYYLKYRSDSAIAFLEYAKNYPGLYGHGEEEQLYHDAFMVELMGAPTIPPYEDINEGNYEIAKKIKEKNFSLPSRTEHFPGVYLEFMNTAHSLDLLRVYPPDSNDAANNKKNIEKFIGETLRYLKKGNTLNEVNIKNCIKDTISMLQYSRRMLDESGEKTTTMVELDNKKIEKILSDPLLVKEIEYVINNPNKLDDTKKSISQFLTDRILRSGDYNYNHKRFNYCHYEKNSNLDEDRDIQREVTSSISMLNAIQRPQFSAGEKVAVKLSAGEKVTVKPVPVLIGPTTSPIMATVQPQSTLTNVIDEGMIKKIIKGSIAQCNITQSGQWKPLINTTSMLIEVGISSHSSDQAINLIDFKNSNYKVELNKDDQLIILDRNNDYSEVTDKTKKASVFYQLLSNIPDQYKLETPKVKVLTSTQAVVVPSTTTVTASALSPPSATLATKQPDYDAYIKNMQALINDTNFLKGKVFHIKTGALGDVFLKNARPSIIDKIKVVINKNKDKNSKIIVEEIQKEIDRISQKPREKTHNSHPDTVAFMEAAKKIDLFKPYFEGDYQIKSTHSKKF